MALIKRAFLAVLLYGSAGRFVHGDAPLNPYLSIVDRNPFGIKPALPVLENTAPPPVLQPLAKVALTGVTSMLGAPRALLEITEQEPGKQPAINKRVLQEGEREGSVEVISIDVLNNVVRIKNGTIETNVVFEMVKANSGPATVGPTPTGLVPPNLPLNAVSSLSASPASPMIISSGGADTPGRVGSTVSFAGANVNPATSGGSANQGLASSYSGNSYAGANRFGMQTLSTYGATDPNRPVANRPIRGDSQPNNGSGLTGEQRAVQSYMNLDALNKSIQANGLPGLPHLQQHQPRNP
jgi:hypothetical protein